MPENSFEKIFSVPAIALDKTVTTTTELAEAVTTHSHVRKARDYWHTLGPGLTTGAADDDPSGIATYSQTGAQFGFNLLWLAAFTFPLMAVVQEMCARIGLVTGRGLAGNIRIYFPRWVLYISAVLLFGANALNIGADLGAMAKATQLLFPQLNFLALLILFTVVSLALQIYTSYEKYAKYLKWLAMILLSYVLTAFLLPNLNWGIVLKAAITPHLVLNKQTIFLICGILGTTVSPYLFFWQTSQEVEEEILEGKTNLKLRSETNIKEIQDMRTDVWSGMFLSNFVMFFIIVTCAATLFSHGIVNINTAADAAQALKPLAGNQAYLLFAMGIIGTGMLAVPVLAGSAAYAIAESFSWKHGLYRKLKDANAFYGVIIFSMLVGLLINLLGIDSIKALIYSAVANGLIAPLVLVLIILISSNKKVMGDFANSTLISGMGWLITIIMVVSGVAAIWSLSIS